MPNFTFGKLPFTVTEEEGMDDSDDTLLFRFTFVNPLGPGNTTPLTNLIEDWREEVPEPYSPSYFDRFRFMKGRKVSTWLVLDIGSVENFQGFSEHLEKLFLRVHDYAPIELVEISNGQFH